MYFSLETCVDDNSRKSFVSNAGQLVFFCFHLEASEYGKDRSTWKTKTRVIANVDVR